MATGFTGFVTTDDGLTVFVTIESEGSLMERYNTDKPHRCPKCHSIPISEPDDHPLFNRRDRLEWKVSELTRELSYRNPIRSLFRRFWRLINPTYAVTKLTLASVTCCSCGTEFTRWPKLPVLKHRGVICAEHQP